MIRTEAGLAQNRREDARVAERRLGTAGRLALLLWSLALLLVVPDGRFLAAAGLALLANLLLYPGAARRLLRPRWLAFALLLVGPSMLWGGPDGHMLGPVPVSMAGLAAGLAMVLRAAVVILAVDGFSSAVDISEVAGLLERAGLPGLGFAMGVAVNLLPALRKSSQTTWRALQMRGGFRRQRGRALQLLLVTVVAGALGRAEEIALAAEVRAFAPQKARALPLRAGALDGVVFVLLVGVWVALLLWPGG